MLNLTIKKFINLSIVSSGVLLMLGFVLSAITGAKLQYPLFIASCVLVFIIAQKTILQKDKLIYFIPLAISIIVSVFKGAMEPAFVLSLVSYFIIPFIFFGKQFYQFDLDPLMKVFGFFTLFYMLGVFLQMLGVTSPVLLLDRAMTDGELHERYGSFAGSSLGLGFTASISAIYYFYLFTYKNKKTLSTLLMIVASILTLLMAQSRRFYVLVFVIMILTYFFNANKNVPIHKIMRYGIWFFLSIAILMYVLFLFRDSSFILKRTFSVFDFEGDGSNVERVTKWLFALEAFLNNFWFGMGIGATGTIGKKIDSTVEATEIFSAESYYIKVLVEGGIFLGLSFFYIMFKFLKKALISLIHPDRVLPGLLFIFFFIECFMSTSLEAPLPTLLFWLCASKLMFKSPEPVNI